MTAQLASPADLGVWWYLSFTNEEKVLGACVVRGVEILHAVTVAHMLGIAHEGDVWGFPVEADRLPALEYRDRALTEADVKAMWPNIEFE